MLDRNITIFDREHRSRGPRNYFDDDDDDDGEDNIPQNYDSKC